MLNLMKYKLQIAVLTIVAALLSASKVMAEEAELREKLDEKWTYSVTWENDFFAQSDDNYTNGFRISAVSPEFADHHWLDDLAAYTPFFSEAGRKRVTYAAGQTMFTPENVFATQIVPDDRPYAGFLFGSAGITSDTGETLDRFNLTLGIVGPSSKAYETQKFVHDARAIHTPSGWDNQLKDEPGFIVSYEKVWKNYADFGFWGFGADMMPKVGASVGNIQTYGSTGVTFRLGKDLPSDYGVPKIRPRMVGSEYFVPTDDFGFYFFADFEGRAVARDIFLDGNTFRDSHSVDKKPLVGDAQFGVALTLQDFRLAYTHIYRTKEFDGQNGAFEPFGAVTLSYRY